MADTVLVGREVDTEKWVTKVGGVVNVARG